MTIDIKYGLTCVTTSVGAKTKFKILPKQGSSGRVGINTA